MKTQETVTETIHHENDLAARLVALDLLYTVLDRKTPLDQALEASTSFAALETRDRNFCRMLLTTTLRRLGQINDLINFAQERPEALKSPKVLHILQLGVTQLFFMDVPDHAAVDTSVRLCENVDAPRQKGFVNAILRNLIRKGQDRLDRQDAGRLNTPEWLLKIWIADYGMSGAGQIANANMSEASLDITLKGGENPSYWAGALDGEILPNGSLRKAAGGNIRDLEGFDTGSWWIQDASASLPARLFGDIKDKYVIDMCAAPGGKTMQLAGMGANVIALDRSANRLKRLEENVKRMELQERVEIVVADGAVWKPTRPATHILLDAPCSATGTIRRHPDTGYLKSPQDISRLMDIQSRLLAHAADILETGGILVYCTCSLQKDEGERQIDKLLTSRSDIKRLPISAQDVGGLPEIIDQNGDIRILPTHLESQGGMDGFYVARITKG